MIRKNTEQGKQLVESYSGQTLLATVCLAETSIHSAKCYLEFLSEKIETNVKFVPGFDTNTAMPFFMSLGQTICALGQMEILMEMMCLIIMRN